MKKIYLYELPRDVFTQVPAKQKAIGLVVESQPFGKDSRFRVAFAKPQKNLSRYKCEDSGRTAGWWQNLLGSGIYRVNESKTVALKGKETEATLTVEGNTWLEIIQKDNELRRTK